ncbi:hypothetical protein [Rhizobacter sp. OV335]|uniref:hypothetical protein n=1 Tax=Rhizobacter sp. OV335 TaxID=1500264 RepID=UPI000936A749|nr:hypothetical protein [Rhizobacter sp. OV335]
MLTPARLFSNSLGLLDESLHVFDENLHVRERMGSARDGVRSARDAASDFLALHNQGWKAAKVLTLPAALACWLAGWHPGMDAAIGAYATIVFEFLFRLKSTFMVRVPPLVLHGATDGDAC